MACAAPINAAVVNEACHGQDIEGANRLLDDNGALDIDGDDIRDDRSVPLRITFQSPANDIRQKSRPSCGAVGRRLASKPN